MALSCSLKYYLIPRLDITACAREAACETSPVGSLPGSFQVSISKLRVCCCEQGIHHGQWEYGNTILCKYTEACDCFVSYGLACKLGILIVSLQVGELPLLDASSNAAECFKAA